MDRHSITLGNQFCKMRGELIASNAYPQTYPIDDGWRCRLFETPDSFGLVSPIQKYFKDSLTSRVCMSLSNLFYPLWTTVFLSQPFYKNN